MIKCGNCGFTKANDEALWEIAVVAFSKILEILNKNISRATPLDRMTASFANKSEVKCPKCGEVGRWTEI
ncbi:MAG: hypothetical protein ACRDDK_09950 [Cetobacterium sp.]